MRRLWFPVGALGGGHLDCRAARQGAWHHTRLIGPDKLDAHVLDLRGRCLMPPDPVAEFAAISKGRRSRGLLKKPAALEARLAMLDAERSRGQARLPAMDPDLAEVSPEEIACLRRALDGTDAAEARKTARRLIDQVVIHPPVMEGDPPSIEVIGDFIAILQTGGLGGNTNENQAPNTEAVCRFVNSAKAGSGANTP